MGANLPVCVRLLSARSLVSNGQMDVKEDSGPGKKEADGTHGRGWGPGQPDTALTVQP